MITGKQLFEDQKLFSTGNDELDELLEEVYYSGLEEGYNYAQKEFSLATPYGKAKRAEKAAFNAQAKANAATQKAADLAQKAGNASSVGAPADQPVQKAYGLVGAVLTAPIHVVTDPIRAGVQIARNGKARREINNVMNSSEAPEVIAARENRAILRRNSPYLMQRSEVGAGFLSGRRAKKGVKAAQEGIESDFYSGLTRTEVIKNARSRGYAAGGERGAKAAERNATSVLNNMGVADDSAVYNAERAMTRKSGAMAAADPGMNRQRIRNNKNPMLAAMPGGQLPTPQIK